MIRFDKSKMDELKEFLYHSDSHDAEIKNSKYDMENKIYYINLYNSILNVEMNFIFYNVKIVMFFKDYNYGQLSGYSDQIYCLSVEENYSLFKSNPNLHDDYYNDTLYLLFETFSGDALHVVCNEVSIDIQRNLKQ